MEQLLVLAEQGKDDSVWHYRIGYSYYFLQQYEQAVGAFTRAYELNPSEDLEEWLEAAREKVERSERQKRRVAADRAQLELRMKNGGNQEPFAGMDLSQFWEDSRYAIDTYVCDPPTEKMIAFASGFGTGGYAEAFVTDWLKDRINNGMIRKDHGKLHLVEGAEADIVARLKETAGQQG